MLKLPFMQLTLLNDIQPFDNRCSCSLKLCTCLLKLLTCSLSLAFSRCVMENIFCKSTETLAHSSSLVE
ncbi:hypothetical protein D1872_330380 [compost metagenome]